MNTNNGFGDRVFNLFNYALLTLIALATIFPFWDSFVTSIIPFEDYVTNRVHLFPTRLDLSTYNFLLNLPELWRSYGVTVFVTVVGTAISMFGTVLAGYALSKNFKGRTIITFLILFTMVFSGGLIPNYIIVRSLGLMDSVWALILPGAISTYNLIVMRSFFQNLPSELEDAAKIDGCSELGTLVRIVLPISKPVLATIGLFYAVGYWNAFFNAIMYLGDRANWPLQLFLRAMLFESEAAFLSGSSDPYLFGAPIKMAAVMVAVLPIAAIYPFFQRYFVKGMLLGAVKE
ncbi:MAG: carbohydrate ABC transporter permease [Chloroflexota bacterium]